MGGGGAEGMRVGKGALERRERREGSSWNRAKGGERREQGKEKLAEGRSAVKRANGAERTAWSRGKEHGQLAA